MEKYSKQNLRGNRQEEDLQNAIRVVITSKLSTNAAVIHYKFPRTLIWLKISRVNLNWGGKLYFHHSRKKSYPIELLGWLKLDAQ
jgi:hypothetical protein